MWNRRTFLSGIALTPALLAAKKKIDWSRISVLTDEVAKTPQEALDFARQYAVQWIELRGIPGARQDYALAETDILKSAAKEFRAHGLKVSFLNTGLLKFGLPGTEPRRARQETPEAKAKRLASEQARFDRRLEDLDKAIRAAEIFDVRKIRVFAFMRVEDPRALFPRLAEILGEYTHKAEKAGVQLLLENEGSCNVATSAELAEICKLVSSKAFGINWDPLNGVGHKETPFPDGYALLPTKRIGNVQIKGKSLLDPQQKLDWAGIFDALAKDGYPGQVGLETHYFDGTLIEKSHLCMKELRSICDRA